MSYEVKIVDDEVGQFVDCIIPDRTGCETRQYFEGRCAAEYSCSATLGVDTVIQVGGQYCASTIGRKSAR